MLIKLLFVASLLLASLVDVSFGQTPAQQNGGVSQVSNGNFDSGNVPPQKPDQWDVLYEGTVQITGDTFNSAPFAARFTPVLLGPNANNPTYVASISQQLTLIEEGQTLTLTFQLKLGDTNSPQVFRAYYEFDEGGEKQLITIGGATQANGFALQTATLTAPPGGQQDGWLKLTFKSQSAAVYYVDDVQITGSLIIGDPQFVGLRGQSYQVHGVDGEVYNLVSSATTQVNSRFVFLDHGECPIINNVPAVNCWSHPGSYLGAIGVQQIVDGEVLNLAIESGSAKQGFASIKLNGKSMKVGEEFVAGDLFQVQYLSAYDIRVVTEQFSFSFSNSDMFINQGVAARVPLGQIKAHGLFGQTHQRKIYNSALKYIAGDVDDYAVSENTLTGKDFVYNQFSA